MDAEAHTARADDVRDRRAMVASTALLLASIVLLSMLQRAFVSESIGGPPQPSVWLRVPGNIIITAATVLFVAALGVHRQTSVWGASRLIIPAAAAASLARAGVFWLTGAWSGDVTGWWFTEWFGGVSIAVCAALLSFFYLHSQRALRAQERISGERATQRELALRTLESEEEIGRAHV